MKLPSRRFRPTVPRLKDRLTIVVLGLLTLLATIGWIQKGNAAPFLAFFVMMLSASWLYYRLRILGSPTLDIDADGVRYRVGKREVAARWSEIAMVAGHFYRNEYHLVRRDGGAPIKFSTSMTSASGERFDMVFDDYLKPSKRA